MSQRPPVKAIGVISGTSMDGIDVSIVETDGDTIVWPGPGRTFSYPDDLRKTLQALIAASGPGAGWKRIEERPGFPGWTDDYASILPLLEGLTR